MLALLRRSIINAGSIAFLALALAGCSPADSVVDIRELHEAGRYRDSLEPLRTLLEADGDNPELHYLYGVALRRTGEPGLAIWSLEMASQTPEFEIAAGLELAGAALGNHSFATAIKATTRILELEPDHVPALSMRGAAYLGERTEPEAALADFEHLLDLDPENFNARVQRALALLLLKRVDEAQEAIAELSQGDQADEDATGAAASICVAAAMFELERGEAEEARSRFDACLETFPAEWPVVSEAIPFFDARNEAERSDAILRTALEAKPEVAAYRTALSDRLLARGEDAEAEALLRAGAELDNASASSHSWAALATLYLSRSDYQAAATAYEKALEFDPDPSQQSLLDFADLLSLSGQHDRALEVAEEFEQPIFRDLIHARILLARDEPGAALERLDKALLLWPNNAAARYHAARAAEQVGQFDRAIEEYRQTIRVSADHTDAPIRLARLLAADRSLMAAHVALGHRLNSHPGDAEAILLALRIAEELNDRGQVKRYLALAQPRSRVWPRALAISADAAARRQGPAAAVDALLGDSRLDFTAPRNAPLLRALVRQMDAVGRLEEAASLTSRAVESHPESAALQAVRGFLLERQGAPTSEVRAAYQRALDLDAGDPVALTRLAKLESRTGRQKAAASLCSKAFDLAALAPDPNPARECALVLAESGFEERAEPRLEDFLREYPYDIEIARALARVRAARDAPAARTAELEQRATRFERHAAARKRAPMSDSDRAESNPADAISPRS